MEAPQRPVPENAEDRPAVDPADEPTVEREPAEQSSMNLVEQADARPGAEPKDYSPISTNVTPPPRPARRQVKNRPPA